MIGNNDKVSESNVLYVSFISQIRRLQLKGNLTNLDWRNELNKTIRMVDAQRQNGEKGTRHKLFGTYVTVTTVGTPLELCKYLYTV